MGFLASQIHGGGAAAAHFGKHSLNPPHFHSRPKMNQEGWTDARSAVGFCLGSGLFGSYNSD